jgi:sirohydrochlorin ferrochelatase
MAFEAEEEGIVIVVWHGSKRSSWQSVVEDTMVYLKSNFSCEVLGVAVDAVQDVLDTVYEKGIRRFTVLPLFVAPGGHVTDDIGTVLDDFIRIRGDVVVRRVPTLLELPEVRQAVLHAVNSKAT